MRRQKSVSYDLNPIEMDEMQSVRANPLANSTDSPSKSHSLPRRASDSELESHPKDNLQPRNSSLENQNPQMVSTSWRMCRYFSFHMSSHPLKQDDLGHPNSKTMILLSCHMRFYMISRSLSRWNCKLDDQYHPF